MMEPLRNAAEVVGRIAGGEDSQTEFKAYPVVDGALREVNAESFAGELVAFANADGGIVLVGVRDDGSLAGYDETATAAVMDWIVNVARNNVIPPLDPILRTYQLDDDDGSSAVIAVHVERGLTHRTSGGRWYRRVGATKRDLDPVEMERLIHQRGTRYAFDESPVPSATLADLDREWVDGVFPAGEDIDQEQLLQNRRVIVGPESRPTVAGLLAFGREPEQRLPQALIRAALYRGTSVDAGRILQEQDIVGPLNQQVDGAVQFVDRWMRHSATKSLGRMEEPQFDLDAVFETVVNAVAHRDYAVAGSRIRLLLFDDRLEVRSPGGLPNTLDLQSIRYRQYTRNQLLVSLLSRLTTPEGRRYIEERGEGVERIIRLSTAVAGREPEFALDGDQLRVTIWGRPLPE